MKIIPLLSIILMIFVSNFCVSGEAISASTRQQIEQIEVEALHVDHRPIKSHVGNLSGVVNSERNSIISLAERSKKKRRKKRNLTVYPHAETVAYVNGYLTHIGNYPQTVVYTELEGPFYGTQTTMTYDGLVLYVNYDYIDEYTPTGVVLHHFYSDSEVVTGSNQIVRFY